LPLAAGLDNEEVPKVTTRLWPKAALSAIGVVAVVLAGAAVAVGSAFSHPVLKSPGKRVHAGVITLIVKDPGVPKSVRPVYVTIAPKKKLNRVGRLTQYKGCSSGQCDFVALKPRKGHPGEWIYKTPFNFPGYWAVTPGKYYWQAQHVAPLCKAKGCEVVSKIRTFTVVG
jgi:hypothetical protein